MSPAPASLPDAPGLPVLRLLAAPCSEPPYDDELGPPSRGPHLLVVPSLRLVPAPPQVAVPPVRPTAPTPDDLSAPRAFAHALVQRLLEVGAGVRPLAQLQRDVTFELYQQLELTLASRPRATGLRPTSRDVRSLHLQPVAPGVAEVCATVQRGPRAGALALRLERAAGSWRCTELAGL